MPFQNGLELPTARLFPKEGCPNQCERPRRLDPIAESVDISRLPLLAGRAFPETHRIRSAPAPILAPDELPFQIQKPPDPSDRFDPKDTRTRNDIRRSSARCVMLSQNGLRR